MTETATTPAPSTAPTPAQAKDKTWIVLCHLSALASFFLPYCGSVIGPLIVWLVKRGEDPEVNAHGKEALNFNISFLIWSLVSWALVFVLIGIVLVPVVLLTWLILVAMGAYRASEGQLYKYPLTIRFFD